jgi:hypothetical protein
MANNDDVNQTAKEERRLEYAETQIPRNGVKEQRGGPHIDQRVGETDNGAHNQGKNPQGLRSKDR